MENVERIKGICKPYRSKITNKKGKLVEKKVAYIYEFKSYEAGVNVVKNDLTKGFKTDYDMFNVVLREFERQTQGRETDVLPLRISLTPFGGGGYFFSGRTAANDLVAAEIMYSSYNNELTEQILRFSVFDPKVDMREILTEFSKDEKNKDGFKPNFSLDNVIGKYRIASVESQYGFSRINWHVEGNHPLATQVYENTLEAMASAKK
jgi:hypothetical protein